MTKPTDRHAAARALAAHLMEVVRAHRGHPFAVVLVVADPNDLDNLHVSGTGTEADTLKMAGEAVERMAKKLRGACESSPGTN